MELTSLRKVPQKSGSQAGVPDSEVCVLSLKGRLGPRGITGMSSLVLTEEEPSHLGHRDSEAGLEYCV